MNIKVAMTVNGNLIEAGNLIRIVDSKGKEHKGTFLRAYPDSKIPNRMNVAIKGLDKEKYAVNGTDAGVIERCDDGR